MINNFKCWFNTHRDMILPSVFVGVVVLLLWSIITFIYEWATLNIPLLWSLISVSDFSSWWEAFGLWGQETISIERSNFDVVTLVTVFITAFVQAIFWVLDKKHKLRSKYLKREEVYVDIISKLSKKDDSKDPE